jgi:hypothetical protein
MIEFIVDLSYHLEPRAVCLHLFFGTAEEMSREP